VTAPVERTTRYATSVDDLGEAWAFVMSRIDSVGPDPTVTIKPYWRIAVGLPGDETPPSERRFEVLVEGMEEVE
jgi:hypothetical protein